MEARYLKFIENLISCLLFPRTEIQGLDNKNIKQLFNEINIKNLLNNYTPNHTFTLDNYLKDGTIPGFYEKRISTPIIHHSSQEVESQFYSLLINALKEQNYTFNENGTLLVSSKELETSIPTFWLYSLSQAFRREHNQRIFLFNKYNDNDLLDQHALENYLHQVKTLGIETFGIPIRNSNEILDKAMIIVNQTNRSKDIVKIDELIELIKKILDEQVSYKIHKFKMPNTRVITSKIKDLDFNFYSLSFNDQKKYIEKWLLEYLNHNSYANNETQKYIVSIGEHNSNKDFSKEEIVSCLFRIYLSNAISLGVDFSNISMTNFHIKTYIGDQQQRNLLELNNIIREINKDSSSLPGRELYIEELNKIATEIEQLNPLTNSRLIDQKYQKYRELIDEYEACKEPNKELLERRNSLQNIIHNEQENDLNDILFDNNKIARLLSIAADEGTIYLDKQSGRVVIELFNPSLGKIIFKCEIKKEKFVEFIKQCNQSIEEYHPKY